MAHTRISKMEPQSERYLYPEKGCIRSKYNTKGGAEGWLGYPTSDEQTNPKGASQQFQGGEVLYCKDGSTVPSIQAKWEELG